MKVEVRLVLWIGVVLSQGVNADKGQWDETAKSVYVKILENHNPIIPPSANVTVEVLLHLSALRKVDMISQEMSTDIHFEFYWDDLSLTWDPSQIPTMKYISMPHSHIWTPKLSHIIRADQNGNKEPNVLTGENVLISPEGRLTWHIYTTLHTVCAMDVTYYPFDQQTCFVKIKSLDPIIQVKLRSANFALLDEYRYSLSWTIIELPAYLNVFPAKSGEYSRSDITYYVTVRRRTNWISQVYPSLALGILTLIPCLLPRFRVGLKVMIQLACLVGISAVYWEAAAKLPSTRLVTPLIFKFLIPLAVLNFIHLSITCLLSHFVTDADGNKLTSKKILDKIRKKLLPKRAAPLETNENLGETFMESDDDLKGKGDRMNGHWICVTNFSIFILLLLGVGIFTSLFICGAPHVGELVDEGKVVEMYGGAWKIAKTTKQN